jgi:hypothetical protein
MLPFDHCCSSVKKELRNRTCRICNQYIPSAYRMKNHYKIHAENYEDFDYEQDDMLPNTTNSNANEKQLPRPPITTAEPPVFKTEMLDWLRSDFDEFDLGPAPTQLASERVTRSMKKLCVEEKKDDNQDWVHVE